MEEGQRADRDLFRLPGVGPGGPGQGVRHQVVGDPVLFDVVFTDSEVNDYRDVTRGNAEQAQTFNKVMRREGILKPDSKFYASIALTEEDLEQTRLAIDIAASSLAS